MTKKQVANYNSMLYALKRIAKLYDTPDQLRKNSQKEYGVDYKEGLEMAYENIQQEAKDASKGIRPIALFPQKRKVPVKPEPVVKGFYVGNEFPEYKDKEILIKDDRSDPQNPCYKIQFIGEEQWHGNMDDHDIRFNVF